MILTTQMDDPAATYPALPAMPALDPAMGQRAPARVRLIAPVTAPLAVTLPSQDAYWRACAVRLAWDCDATCAARYLGHSARGSESYAVRLSQHPSRRGAYRVTFTPRIGAQTVEDGRWLCECPAGRAGQPCAHVGASALLANRRAIRRESVLQARYERLSGAHATLDGLDSHNRAAYYRIGRAHASRWSYVRVAWDTANDVALYCECGVSGPCAHVGAVALRRAQEHADALFAATARRHAHHATH